jgi:DNA-directed RNA polymerase specialized sigma24 family protein
LRYNSNLSFAEIGVYLDKSEGSVKVQHHRLLKKLRILLEQTEQGQPQIVDDLWSDE